MAGRQGADDTAMQAVVINSPTEQPGLELGGRGTGEQAEGDEMVIESGQKGLEKMVEIDPFQAAFDLKLMDIDPLPENTCAVPEGLPCEGEEEKGTPPRHLPAEQKLVSIADWLMTNLKAKKSPLTDDFWDKTYLDLFPMLDMSASLKNVLENGLQPGVRWTEAWHRLASIVFARFQPPHSAAAEEVGHSRTQTATANEQTGEIQTPPVLQPQAPPPDPAPPDPDENTPLDLVRKRKLRHLIEMGQDMGPLSQAAVLLLSVRKKNGKWEVGLTPVENGKIRGVTLQGWSSFWAGPQHCQSEAAAGILQMQLDTHIADFMPPGAQATASVTPDPNRISQRDVYIRCDPAKEAGLRWHTHPQLLDMQTVRIIPSETWTEQDIQRCLCALLRLGLRAGAADWDLEQLSWNRL
ncbi:hypothetical protein CBR_g18893 [Chara braunii]|uniref:Uncharacterized protein n=1 Tax=Chara braunii TaxID=69332 RepID=A0A388KWZ8_CHABU|nr:hypothetical protein CBR_g18893 [Chara braunii]|eukprot:GBG74483.1 hypothetical protein CBR_g18893 [Chara braunii]